MQLTQLDRWLRKKFVYQTHLYALRRPDVIPARVRVEELPDVPGRQYHYKFITNSEKAVNALVQIFTEHNQIYTTRVVDRSAWYVPLIAPKGKSVTWWLIWAVLSVIGASTIGTAFLALWRNPDFQKNLEGALETLKG